MQPADPGPAPGASMHDCSDPIAASGPDGTLYVGAGWADGNNYYDVYISRSRDRGRTWSAPLFVAGDRSRDGLDTTRSPSRPDRPFLVVDQATGTLYASVNDFVGTQRYVSVSHDRGTTFSPLRPVATNDYPAMPFNNVWDVPAAYGGIIAFAYNASPDADANIGANGCPCDIFETSRDEGGTWTRHVAPFSGDGLDFVVADPRGLGRFSMVGVTGSTVEVATTMDAGQTWSRTHSIVDPTGTPFQPWAAYNRRGELGIVWKSQKPQGDTYPACSPIARDSCASYDFWAVISHDEGNSWSKPIRISHAVSPADNATDVRDDSTFVVLDDTTLYAMWGDLRTSPSNPAPAARALYLGRVSL